MTRLRASSTRVAIFQSTLPLREVTQRDTNAVTWQLNFNPHFPWGKWRILVESDFKSFIFQSTLPLREVTYLSYTHRISSFISIHTSPEGSDLNVTGLQIPDPISIHTSPEGSDANCFRLDYGSKLFQSTLPLREVTISAPNGIALMTISIHTSPEGSDVTV